jgi:cation:H+ antiporter
MAVGIILGSNCFNILIFFFADLFYFKGPIAQFASPENIIALLLGICLTAILSLGIIYRSEKAFLRMGWGAILILCLYITTGIWLFKVTLGQ